jgi:hypothetical protein
MFTKKKAGFKNKDMKGYSTEFFNDLDPNVGLSR